MYKMDYSNVADDQKHWSGWTTHRPKSRVKINNYLSAVVLALSAFVVMASQMA